jgi:ubiquinone biosynthesis protein UbiJ
LDAYCVIALHLKVWSKIGKLTQLNYSYFFSQFLSVCGLGWTFILSVYAGSAKSYSTPAAEEEKECSDPAEQMAMAAQAVTEEQYANAPEEVMAEAAAQTQRDETTSTGSRVAGRKLASSKV